MTPTLRQLEYIVAVAETGQFVEAARRCSVSQPALSKQVREVEDLLGVDLFERTRPRVIVTSVGVEIVLRAKRLLAGVQELVEVANTAASERRGTIRLGVIPTIAPYGLPGLLVKLRQLIPDVSFAIQELQTEQLVDRLRGGAIDLGLLAHTFNRRGLAGVDLVVEPFVLAAPVDHILGRHKSISPEDIAGASLILMEDGHCLRDQAIDVCNVVGNPPPTSVTAASISTLMRMVESGLGPTLLPSSALAIEMRPDQGVVFRGFEAPQPGRTLTLQWRPTSPNADWYASLGDILREHYLGLNDFMPVISGPSPVITSA